LLLNKKIRKKFSKKYTFLETTLMEFLNWRRTNLNLKYPLNAGEASLTGPNMKKLQLEKIRMKELDIFTESNQFNAQEIVSSDKTIRNQTLNNKQFLLNTFENKQNLFSKKTKMYQKTDIFRNKISLPFQINPGTFFPQKKVFMQYWIFPLVGFVGLTWNKSENLFTPIKDISVSEIETSFDSSFYFPIKNPKQQFDAKNAFYQKNNIFVKKNNSFNQKRKSTIFEEYYFIAQTELQTKIQTLTSNSLNEVPQSKINIEYFKTLQSINSDLTKLVHIKDVNYFGKEKNILKYFPFFNKKTHFKDFSAFHKSSFSFSKNNVLLEKKLCFFSKTNEVCRRKAKQKTFYKNTFFLYEKSPKKILLFPFDKTSFFDSKKKSKPLTNFVFLKQIKQEPFCSIINIPKIFKIQPNKNTNKNTLKNMPIYSYEKAKVLLDNVLKMMELNTNDLNIENLSSIKNIEKLKNQSYIINNSLSKSNLLNKFTLLNSMNLTSVAFFPQPKVTRQTLFIEKNKVYSEKEEKKEDKSLLLSNTQKHWLKTNQKNQFILKKIPAKLKFDLDKFLFLKKFCSLVEKNKEQKEEKEEKEDHKILKLNLDAHFKNLNFLKFKFKSIKEGNPLNTIDIQNIKNKIFEISILNYWKNSLNLLNLYEKKMYSPSLIKGKDSTFFPRKNFSLENSKIFVFSKNIDFNNKKNLILNKSFLKKLVNLQKQILELNEKHKNEKNESEIFITTFNNPILVSGSLISSEMQMKSLMSTNVLNDLYQKSKEFPLVRQTAFFDKTMFIEKNNVFFKEENKDFLNPFGIKFFWNMKSISQKESNQSLISKNSNSYISKSLIHSKENYSNTNVYFRKKVKIIDFARKPLVIKKNKVFYRQTKFALLLRKPPVFEQTPFVDKTLFFEKPEVFEEEEKEEKEQKTEFFKTQNFIFHLKEFWFINSKLFTNQFYCFVNNLSNKLYQTFKQILFYESKLGSMNYTSYYLYTKTKALHPLKLMKRKKQFKNNTFLKKEFSNMSFSTEVQHFKTNLKKMKKEKIFRTLLSYKSSEEGSKKMLTNEVDISSTKLKNVFLRLKRRIKKFNRMSSQNKVYKKNKNQQIMSFISVNLKGFENSKNSISDSYLQKKPSLNHLFRRIGFVFLSELKIKNNFSLNEMAQLKIKIKDKNKSSTSLNRENEFSKMKESKKSIFQRSRQTEFVAEKEKFLQKKRRRKKLKLETRRRKKRKRFYPRPIWLRYNLYKSFLNKRHFYRNKNTFLPSKSLMPSLVTFKTKNKLKKTKQFYSFSMLKFFVKNQKLKDKIYRNNKQKWGNFIQETLKKEKISLNKFNFFSNFPIYQNKDYYKVSNRILSEFQPLCWKSYWLRSNLMPYMNRIQKNFDKMKMVEKTKNVSNINSFLSKILGFKKYDYAYNMQEILPFYTNFKNSFDNQYEFYLSNFSIFENMNNIAEYNRIEFERFSEILKNVKFNMNLEGQNKPKSYKFMAWKYLISLRELKAQNKKNFWNRFAYNMKPDLSAGSPFVFFSNFPFNTNSSLKPYKSNATLRVLWSFNKTNQFTFKEKNQIRDLWETSKLRDQLKANQTKKFLMNLLKVKNHFYSSSSSRNFVLAKNAFTQKPEVIEKNKFKNFKKMYFSTAKKYETIQKKLVLMTLFQPKSRLISYKTRNQNKQNNISIHNYIRLLKTNIANLNSKSPSDQRRSIKKKGNNPVSYYNSYNKEFSFLKKKQDTSFLWESKPRLLKPSSFFWWSSKNYSMPLNLNSFNSSNVIYKQSNSFLDKTGFLSNKNITSNLLIFSILFHLSVLFSFVRIPELRSLLKFQLLLFYKISNNYFIILYSVYNLLKKYKKQTFMFYNNFYKKSSNLFNKNSIFGIEKDIYSKNIVLSANEFSERRKRRRVKSKNIWYQQFKNKQKLKKISSFLNPFSLNYLSQKPEFYFFSFPSKFEKSFFKHRSNQNNKIKDFINSKKLNQQILEWNLNVPKITNKDWKLYNQSLRKEKKWFFTNSVIQKTFSKTPFVYTFSYNMLQSVYSKKLFHKLLIINKMHFIEKNNVFYRKKTPFFFEKEEKNRFSVTSFQIQFALFFLFLSYNLVCFSSFLMETSYQFLLKIIDLFESFLLIIYKFLEKPAELMIEWIAQIFLIEWSSDISTFIPETFDMYFWNTFQKFFRYSRILGFVEFQNSTNIYYFLNTFKNTNHPFYEIMTGSSKGLMQGSLYGLNIENKMPFVSLIPSNIFGFFMQRRLWHFFHLFMDSMLTPDIDLMVRQKKGKIFWDIWAEILIRAAEQYNINIPSLTSLKEEQEKLIERLIQDPNFGLKNQKLSKKEEKQQKKEDYENFFVSFSFRNQNKKFMLKTRSKVLKQKFKNNFLNSFSFSNLFKNSYKTKSWSSNQYVTFNLKDTDLFLDISPPKSLLSVNFINSYEPIQYTLGSIMCEIYSGLFSMKVSKNLLIVNSQVSNFSNSFYKDSFNAQSKGSYGSLIIQALAGESEMKMMVDNANRYASIQRGIAVGMKLLRDVFESIVLQTPCFFLMEDIHVIGERRPMLISDDENSKAAVSVFGVEQDEESEKNQMIYQSSRHSISDFRRPYKGDFSMLIPTNLYNKDLYSFKKFQTNLKPNQQKKYPMSLPSIENLINEQTSNKENISNKSLAFNISCLQISSESFFAPPATSPFTILMMKEQKKLKPKKVVKQTIWNSFITENITSNNMNNTNNNIRVKVAILADMTLRNFSVKLDMITDLLVIIDSVRSNRGFVVFATTHLPSILDPALRRPGRFDETISLPLLPNLMNRWSLFKMHFNATAFQNKHSTETFDQFEYGMLTENFRLTQISDLISKTKRLIFNNYNSSYYIVNNQSLFKEPLSLSNKTNTNNAKTAFFAEMHFSKKLIHPSQSFQSFFIDPNSLRVKNSKKAYTQLSFGYFQIGNILILLDLLKDQTAFSLYNKSLILDQSSTFVYHSLYSSLNSFKTFLIRFLGGKMAEFLIIKNSRKKFILSEKAMFNTNKKNSYYSSLFELKNNQTFINEIQQKSSFSSKKNDVFFRAKTKLFSKNLNFSIIDQQVRYKSWHFAKHWIFSILQKRFLYHKNLIITKMLTFDNPNQSSLREPPSPPASSLLMPSKKYENFKRVERDFQQKSVFSIYEKMQMHQKQRFLKKLYNKPVLDSFKSQLYSSSLRKENNHLTSFDSAFKELAENHESYYNKPSSSLFYYKNRLNIRHRFSLINQWWNGQLAEHNVEVTYLSDIDWRTMYIQSNSKGNVKKSSLNIDSILDFPDADQHYNQKTRRWFLTSNSWNYWLNLETNFYYEIYYHMIYDSFNKTSIYFDQNRELLDFFVSTYLQRGSLKELDFIFIFSRFYR